MCRYENSRSSHCRITADHRALIAIAPTSDSVVVEPGVDPGTFRFSDRIVRVGQYHPVPPRQRFTWSERFLPRGDTRRHAANAGFSRDARDFRGIETAPKRARRDRSTNR